MTTVQAQPDHGTRDRLAAAALSYAAEAVHSRGPAAAPSSLVDDLDWAARQHVAALDGATADRPAPIDPRLVLRQKMLDNLNGRRRRSV